jgi:hypothetical protein
MVFIKKLLKKMVEDENEKTMLIELFKKALPKQPHFDNFNEGLKIGVHTHPIYSWFEGWCVQNISSPILLEMCADYMYDETIYWFLEEICDKYGDDITYEE